MSLDEEYNGKIILSYETRSEQIAIAHLYHILKRIPVEDLVFILDGFDARDMAIKFPGWASQTNEASKSI